MMPGYCYFMLTCANSDEADKISDALLDAKLVVCAKKLAVSSNFLWKEAKEKSEETMLLLTSREDLFGRVEAAVERIHSYETFVLECVPIKLINRSAADWIDSLLDQ